MPLIIKNVHDLARLLQGPPAFDSDDAAWQNVTAVAQLLSLTDTGLLRIRKRLQHTYEHRHKQQVFIFMPLWLRLWQFEKNERDSRGQLWEFGSL